jgi:predicted transposase/invertase (TIGR01784 family)
MGMYLVNLAADRQLLYIGCIIRYMNEVRPLEAQDELWEELEETLRPILGENYMLSIAEALRQEGMQQGMQQGSEQTARQIAKNFLESGIDIAVIAKSTGLDIDLLKKLKEETKH